MFRAEITGKKSNVEADKKERPKIKWKDQKFHDLKKMCTVKWWKKWALGRNKVK